MALGGIFSISDKRYRMAKVKKLKQAVNYALGDKLADNKEKAQNTLLATSKAIDAGIKGDV